MFTYNATSGFIIATTEGTLLSPISYEEFYQADLANGWGVITRPAPGIYNMTAHIQLGRNTVGTQCHFNDNGDVMVYTEEGPGTHNQRMVVRNNASTTHFRGEAILGYEHTVTTYLLWTIGTDITFDKARFVAKYINEFQVRMHQPSSTRKMDFNLCMLNGVTPTGSPGIEDCIFSGIQNIQSLSVEGYPKYLQYTTITDTPDTAEVLNVVGSHDSKYTPPGWTRTRWFTNIYRELRIKNTDAKLFNSPYFDTYYQYQDAVFLDMVEVPNWEGSFPYYLIGEPPGVLEMYTFDPIIQYPNGTMVPDGILQAVDFDGVVRVNTPIVNGIIDYNGYTEFPYADLKALRANRHYCDMNNGNTLHKDYNPYTIRIVADGKSWEFMYYMTTKMDGWYIILFPSTHTVSKTSIIARVDQEKQFANVGESKKYGKIKKAGIIAVRAKSRVTARAGKKTLSSKIKCKNE